MSVGRGQPRKSELRGREISKEVRQRETPAVTRQDQAVAATAKSPLLTRETHAAALTVRVSMDLRRRGGRKLVIVPSNGSLHTEGQDQALEQTESPLVRLLARAFYWKSLFDSGNFGSLEELAAAEQVDRSYLSKVLRLTLLAPNTVEAIVEGREPKQLTIGKLLASIPIEWREQGGGFFGSDEEAARDPTSREPRGRA